MEVQIGELSSTVRAVDGDALLAPQTLERIVRAVLQAVRDEQEHARRVQSEQRVTPGVSFEQREEGQYGWNR
jgi:hypothetical protein